MHYYLAHTSTLSTEQMSGIFPQLFQWHPRAKEATKCHQKSCHVWRTYGQWLAKQTTSPNTECQLCKTNTFPGSFQYFSAFHQFPDLSPAVTGWCSLLDNHRRTEEESLISWLLQICSHILPYKWGFQHDDWEPIKQLGYFWHSGSCQFRARAIKQCYRLASLQVRNNFTFKEIRYIQQCHQQQYSWDISLIVIDRKMLLLSEQGNRLLNTWLYTFNIKRLRDIWRLNDADMVMQRKENSVAAVTIISKAYSDAK